VNLSYYLYGAPVGTPITANGSWYVNGGLSYCTFGNLSNLGVWTETPSVAAGLRIVASVQKSVTTGKASVSWSNIPFKIELFDQCQDGVQDGDETGVDCGGSCKPCIRKCPGKLIDCNGDGSQCLARCP
jgi:hypothetical protein